MKNHQRRVFGFTLSVGKKTQSISKRLYDVNVSDQEDGSTKIMLVSPEGRTRVRAASENSMFPLKYDSEEFQVEVTVSEWEALKEGKVLTYPWKNRTRYLCLNLDRLLEIPGVNIEEKRLNALDGYISSNKNSKKK